VKRLLRRVLDYRRIGRRRWYLPIVLLNPAILMGSYGAMSLLGRPLPDPHVSLATAPLLLLVFLPPAVGEEEGWMGYAIDPLQDRWGTLKASLIWLYNNTGKSLFAAVLFHALSNVSVALFPNAGSHYDPAVTGVLTVVVASTEAFLWGARTLARFRPSLTRPGALGGTG
jgi:uncharacterized protein